MKVKDERIVCLQKMKVRKKHVWRRVQFWVYSDYISPLDYERARANILVDKIPPTPSNMNRSFTKPIR